MVREKPLKIQPNPLKPAGELRVHYATLISHRQQKFCEIHKDKSNARIQPLSANNIQAAMLRKQLSSILNCVANNPT
jgi:hypothetical protein